MESGSPDILRRIEAGNSLPSLSPVAMKLVSLASEENVALNALAAAIEKDPSLTVRLLKLANSALLRAGGSIMNVQHAISMIGVDRLRIMALSLSLRDTFPLGRVGPLDYEEFWRTSLYQALLAKSLAQELRNCHPDEAFVGGLTLEIGLLVFFELFLKGKQNDERLSLHPLEPLLGWEESTFGVTHREVGAAALTHWRFPPQIVACQRAVAFDTLDASTPELVKVCAIAREAAGLICEESMEWHPLFEKAEKIYRIDQDVLGDILVKVFEEVEEIAGGLKVEMNRKKDLMELMEKAHKALGRLSDRIASAAGHDTMPVLATLDTVSPSVRATLQAVVHEIRNPLTAVGGFARRLSHSLLPSSDEWNYAQVIVQESERIEKALKDMTGGRMS